ncbi:hypothetical protein ACIBK9_25545 [Nonomuraea sp. NPDC050227]|uniref:hypothetical protein n=1 Tax=Nonomuraea sp. NPDC050227 TaxID=3364360 RepID=UPI0037AF3465
MPGAEHYRRVLDEQQWLHESGLCWSVIRTRGGHRDIAHRLAPDTDPEVRELDPREDPLNFSPLPLIFVDEQSDTMSLIQTNGGDYLRSQDALARLSQDGEAWAVSWGPSVNVRLAHARGGNYSYVWRTFGDAADPPTSPFGDWLAAVIEAEREDDWTGVQAHAMAAVDGAARTSLDAAWFDDDQRAFIIDYPEPAPEPLLSPFAHTDPGRTSSMEALPHAVRREVLLVVAETMRDRFDLDIPPGLPDALRRGDGLSDTDRESLTFLLEDACASWERSGKHERLHAMLAFRSALRAASSDAANFDALASARAALGAQWPELDIAIQRLASP